MLVYFSAENFRSINQSIELNLRAAPKLRRHKHHLYQPSADKKLKVLKSALLYGANASGKSNIIKAIDFAQNLIVSPPKITQSINSEPFLFDNGVNTESSFYFEFVAANKHFGFGVKYDNNRILEESLYLFEGDKEICFYSRTTSLDNTVEVTGDLIDNWPEEANEYLQEFKFIAKYTAPNRVLLSEIEEKSLVDKLSNHNSQLLLLALCFLFFKHSLIVIYPKTKYTNLFNLVGSIDTNNILNGFDTNINSLGSSRVDKAQFPVHLHKTLAEELLVNNSYPFIFNNQYFQANINEDGIVEIFHIFANHLCQNNKDVELEINQESDGTQRLIDLIPILSKDNAHKIPLTYIIDEFDRSLHPNLAKKFFELFLSLNNRDQLIVTTHQSELLDNQLLRRDEIWFVQKEWDQSTRLYSLNDYSTRFDKDIHKAYLEGKFGGVPVIKDELEKLANINNKAN